MCHIMMTVAACSSGFSKQTCHAGASVLVCPASAPSSESIAVLSSCIFSSDEAWETVRKRGERLGIDLKRLRKAFMSLPQTNESLLRVLKLSLQTMSYALKEVNQCRTLKARLGDSNLSQEPSAILKTFLKNTTWVKNSRHREPGGRGKSLLVRVVTEMVQQRPDLPLTVKELAAAAGLTPNHFSSLFHTHTGSSFNDYLTQQRIVRACKLLLNPTLSINEIARLTGYEDPGYFTRRFHQETGLSPSEWRNRKAGLGRQSEKS
jgi:AraC-like DNA-binding protein